MAIVFLKEILVRKFLARRGDRVREETRWDRMKNLVSWLLFVLSFGSVQGGDQVMGNKFWRIVGGYTLGVIVCSDSKKVLGFEGRGSVRGMGFDLKSS